MKIFAQLILGLALLVYAQPAFAQSAALINGTPTAGHCAQFTGSHNGIIDAGGACSGSLTNPAALGAVNLRSGSGAPSASDPTGSAYFRTDTGWTYQMLPAATPPARVQEVASSTSYTLTLPAAPTSGNWLIGYCHDNGTPAVGTGWTSIATWNTPSTGLNTLVVRKQAGIGESATQTPCTGASAFWRSSAIIEVTGGPVWSDIYDGVTFADKSSLTTTAARATTVGNSLAIGFSGWTLGCCADTLSLRTGDGWTNVKQDPSSSTSTGEAAFVGSQTAASGGTTLSFSTSTATQTGGGMTNAVLILKPGSGYFSWQKLSGLATIKNGGTTLESDPRSFNCAGSITCTTNGVGDVTATGAGAAISGTPTTGNCVKWASSTSISDAGAACGSGGGGGGGTYEAFGAKPTCAGLTWNNQGVATCTDGTKSMVISTVSASSNWRTLELTAPATPYSVYLRADNLGQDSTDNQCGISFRNSTSDKRETFTWYNNPGQRTLGQTWTNATTYGGTTWLDITQSMKPQWLKATNDGTNLTFYVSPNGSDFAQVATRALATFITSADKIGVGCWSANGTSNLFVGYFSTTAPS